MFDSHLFIPFLFGSDDFFSLSFSRLLFILYIITFFHCSNPLPLALPSLHLPLPSYCLLSLPPLRPLPLLISPYHPLPLPLFLSSILLSIHFPSLYYPLLILLPLLVLHFLSPSTHFHLHITLSFSSFFLLFCYISSPIYPHPCLPPYPLLTPSHIPRSRLPPPVARTEGGGRVPRHFPEGAAMSHTLSPITSYSPKGARGRGRSKEVDYC